MTGAEQKKELHSSVYDIAKRLRGLVLANNYKDYILGIVFYRFLSEKIENRADKLLAEDNISYAEAWKDEEYKELLIDNLTKQVGYIIEPGDLFSQFVKDIENGKFDIEKLQFAINNLVDSTRGKESEDDFNNLFDGMVLSSHIIGNSVKERSQTLSEIIGGVNNIDFSHDETEVDVLGDIYEYIIKYFASNAGQKAGEFYTPQPVSTLLAKLVTLGKTEVKSIYDPTCGSGSLLVRVSRQLEKIGRLYGQEKNPVTYNLARMNMLLHDISYKKFEILQGDTLENPKHLDERFEIIVANPPYSTPWSADSKFLEDERFSAYGKLAPSSKADYAFVQHMIHQLDDNGTMAVVLPHGILFRGNAEGVIRRYMVEEKNYIDAVIGLPENMFFGASIPTCIVVFKKCKTDNDTVVFIDASKEFEKDGNKNAINNEHIEKIVKAYEDRVDIDKYCHVATLSEIAENDYNLNIPRYVDTFEEEPEVDLAAVKEKIASLKVESEQLNKDIDTYLAELGL